MNEGQMRQAIKRYLPRIIHRQSMTGATEATNGTPDDYFDGTCDDMWVEFKVITHWPRSGILTVAPILNVKKQPRGRLTVLQANWIKRRHDVGQNAHVMLGLPDRKVLIIQGCDIYDDNIVDHCETVTLKDAAEWIIERCGD